MAFLFKEYELDDFLKNSVLEKDIESSEKVEPRLLTVKEAAVYLNVSTDFIYKKVRAEADVVMVGRGIRFTQEALDKWITNNTNRHM